MAILAVYLRQRGSPESKPVGAPHDAPASRAGRSGRGPDALLGPAGNGAVPAERARASRRSRPSGPASTRVNVSDHFQPWWEPGSRRRRGRCSARSASATESRGPRHRRDRAGVPLQPGHGRAVHRDHRGAVSPAARFLGVGSGEALNESPCGMDWPYGRRADRPHGGGARDHQPAARRRAAGPRRALLPHQGRLPAHPRRASARRCTSPRSGRTPRRSPGGSATVSGRWATPRWRRP